MNDTALRTAPRTEEAPGKCRPSCTVVHQRAHLSLTSLSHRLRPPGLVRPPPRLPPSLPLSAIPSAAGSGLFYCQPISRLHKGGLCNRSFQMPSIWKNIPIRRCLSSRCPRKRKESRTGIRERQSQPSELGLSEGSKGDHGCFGVSSPRHHRPVPVSSLAS